MDGSSCKDGSEARVVLISPKGDKVKIVVFLNFISSNNEAEYEAALEGLQATINMKSWRIHVFFDSQLVAQ